VSKFNVHPEHMRQSGSKLSDFGGKIAHSGQKMETAGQNLLAHASGDKSGFGSVISKAFGKGLQVTGKVFNEGGRVAEGAGQRLHASANLYEDADNHGAGLLKKLHPDAKGKAAPKGGGIHKKPAKRSSSGGRPPGKDSPDEPGTAKGGANSKKSSNGGTSRSEQQRKLRELHGEPKPNSDWLSNDEQVPHVRHPGLNPGSPAYDAITGGRKPPTGNDLARFNEKWSDGRNPKTGFEDYRYPTEEYGHPNGFRTPGNKKPSGFRRAQSSTDSAEIWVHSFHLRAILGRIVHFRHTR
jgi:hypothetical protein